MEVPDGDHEENKSRKNRTGLRAWNGCGTFGASAPDNEQLYDSGHYPRCCFSAFTAEVLLLMKEPLVYEVVGQMKEKFLKK